MHLELSFEKATFISKTSKNIYVFFIYDITEKTTLNLRISNSKIGRVDQLRTIFSAIKKKLPQIEVGDTFFLNNKECVFSNIKDELFKECFEFISKTENTEIMTSFSSFFSEMIDKKSLRSSAILKDFNKFLTTVDYSEYSEVEDKLISFLDIDFEKEKQRLNKEFETIFYERKKSTYIEQLNWLQQEQLLIDEKVDKNKLKSLLLFFIIKSNKFKEVTQNNEFSLRFTSFFVPNSFEIETIFRNAGMSVTRKSDYFSSFFKFAFFCLYYLGLDLDEIFVVRKDDLLTIITEELITLNLNPNEEVKRTILSDTRERFISLEKDLSIIFEDCNQITYTNSKKHFSTKNLSYILNKDLRQISEVFFSNTFKVDSLKNSAPIRLLKRYPNFYVSKEFKITESFTKRLEQLYQTKLT